MGFKDEISKDQARAARSARRAEEDRRSAERALDILLVEEALKLTKRLKLKLNANHVTSVEVYDRTAFLADSLADKHRSCFVTLKVPEFRDGVFLRVAVDAKRTPLRMKMRYVAAEVVETRSGRVTPVSRTADFAPFAR